MFLSQGSSASHHDTTLDIFDGFLICLTLVNILKSNLFQYRTTVYQYICNCGIRFVE